MSAAAPAALRRALPERTQKLVICHREHFDQSARGEHAVRQVVFWRSALACPEGTPPYRRAAAGLAGLFAALPAKVGPLDLLAAHYGGLAARLEPAEWEVEQQRLVERSAATMGVGERLPPALATALDDLAATVAPIEGGVNPAGHHLPDYEQVLEKGLLAMADEADAAARGLADPERAAASRGMAETLRAFVDFCERHGEVASGLAAPAEPTREAELRALAAVCRQVPGRPARTFYEAVQAVWFVFFGLNVTEIPSANTLGRLDQLLYPYYAADRAAGRLDEETAFELVAQLLLKAAGSSRGQALTLGGRTAAGDDATNDLTRLFLQAAASLNIGSPILALFVHDDMAAEDLDLAAAVTRYASGQLSYYSWDCAGALLAERDLPAADRARVAVNSCMGVVPAGLEVSNMWGCVLLLPALLESVAAGGVSRDGVVYEPFGRFAKPPEAYGSVEELIAAYERAVAAVAALGAERFRALAAFVARRWPNPLVSSLLDDCRARGRDRLDGGPRYHSCICELLGWANVSDSLVAIDELVFRRRVTTLAELVAAARADWAGHAELHRQVLDCPKYGNGDPRADGLARRVIESAIETVCAQRRAGEHAEFLPSLHTHGSHVGRGAKCPVSLDGRRYGGALNKQLGPSVWAATAGPTGAIASAARMPCSRLTGGQALDLAVPPSILDDAAGRERFRALLRTFFAQGGGQVQVNCVDSATLRAAQETPEEYSNLLIRIGGHSDRFVNLDRPLQDDLIARIGAGL